MKHIADRLYELLLGCSHRNVTRPFTLHGHTYVVCRECGQEFAYSLVSMRTTGILAPGNDDVSGLTVQHSH